MIKKINKIYIMYYNNIGFLHKENGPALEWSNGFKVWYINGYIHRLDGPARDHSEKFKTWSIKGWSYKKDIFNSWIKRIKYYEKFL